MNSFKFLAAGGRIRFILPSNIGLIELLFFIRGVVSLKEGVFLLLCLIFRVNSSTQSTHEISKQLEACDNFVFARVSTNQHVALLFHANSEGRVSHLTRFPLTGTGKQLAANFLKGANVLYHSGFTTIKARDTNGSIQTNYLNVKFGVWDLEFVKNFEDRKSIVQIDSAISLFLEYVSDVRSFCPAALIANAGARLKGVSFEMCISHGDCTEFNLYTDGAGVFFSDFDFFSEESPRGFDLVRYVYSHARYANRYDPQRCINAIRHSLFSVFEEDYFHDLLILFAMQEVSRRKYEDTCNSFEIGFLNEIVNA